MNRRLAALSLCVLMELEGCHGGKSADHDAGLSGDPASITSTSPKGIASVDTPCSGRS